MCVAAGEEGSYAATSSQKATTSRFWASRSSRVAFFVPPLPFSWSYRSKSQHTHTSYTSTVGEQENTHGGTMLTNFKQSQREANTQRASMFSVCVWVCGHSDLLRASTGCVSSLNELLASLQLLWTVVFKDFIEICVWGSLKGTLLLKTPQSHEFCRVNKSVSKVKGKKTKRNSRTHCGLSFKSTKKLYHTFF